MSNLIKTCLLLFALYLPQQVLGMDRHFLWIEPQNKLRSRIDVQTFELFKENKNGLWENEGKINLDPNILNRLPSHFENTFFILDEGQKILFQIIGTGQVYEYKPEKKELTRVDKTFHSGYNFTSNQFIRNKQLYSAGGEGFWSYHSSITYFDEKLREWEIIRPKNKGPQAVTNGYQGYDSKRDIFYSGGSKYKNYLEPVELIHQTDLYVFDFPKNEWQILGKLNAELLNEKKLDIIWTGELFLHFTDKVVKIIDPEKK